jgi:hypothetical protein
MCLLLSLLLLLLLLVCCCSCAGDDVPWHCHERSAAHLQHSSKPVSE